MAKKKKWIGKAINPKHKGAFKKKAQSAGQTTAQFAEQHKHDGGMTGEQARLAIVLMGMRPKKKMPKSEMKMMYNQKGARNAR